MARRTAIGNMKRSLKSKATNSAKQSLYMAMWGESVPKRKKRVK